MQDKKACFSLICDVFDDHCSSEKRLMKERENSETMDVLNESTLDIEIYYFSLLKGRVSGSGRERECKFSSAGSLPT